MVFLIIGALLILDISLPNLTEKNIYLLFGGGNGNILHYANGEEVTKIEDIEKDKLTSNSLLYLISIGDKVEGTLVVTTRVVNEYGGSSKPSDFVIYVHGNNPSSQSFLGNSTGIVIKLDMGMYSITESGPSSYVMTSSPGCAGAVMSVKTIRCDITNTYVKSNANDP